ncbi:MAG: hypothetical protein VW865_14130, partial [Halieaceae bacterium]
MENPGLADLRKFRAHVLFGSDTQDSGLKIFDYESNNPGDGFSTLLRVYRIGDAITTLQQDNEIFLKLYREDGSQPKTIDVINNVEQTPGWDYATQGGDQIDLLPDGVELQANASLFSSANSRVNVKYDLTETNLVNKVIFTMTNFTRIDEGDILVPAIGANIISQESGEVAVIESITNDTVNDVYEVTATFKANIKDPFKAENEYLQVDTAAGYVEGFTGRSRRFNVQNVDTSTNPATTQDLGGYNVTKLRFKTEDDNTSSDTNIPLMNFTDNSVQISKLLGNSIEDTEFSIGLSDKVVGVNTGVSGSVNEIRQINNIDEVVISEGTKFICYIMNRKNTPTNPNVSINDISRSYVIPFDKQESYEELKFKTLKSTRLVLDDFNNSTLSTDRYKSIQADVSYEDESDEFAVNDELETIRISAAVEEAAGRFKDANNQIINNRTEIIDRSLAEIAVQHPDFYFPG